jgi:hypothetical protein
VQEMRDAYARIARNCGDDFRKIVEHFEQVQSAQSNRVVRRSRQRIARRSAPNSPESPTD